MGLPQMRPMEALGLPAKFTERRLGLGLLFLLATIYDSMTKITQEQAEPENKLIYALARVAIEHGAIPEMKLEGVPIDGEKYNLKVTVEVLEE